MAVRISGVNIPMNKEMFIALTHIKGIGITTARKICEAASINPVARVKDISEPEFARVRSYIDENLMVESALTSEVTRNIKRLIDIASYRGLRHRTGLPVRGQNTKTNSRTRKGKRKIVANKKK